MEIEEITTALTHLFDRQCAKTGLEITLQADSLSREIVLSANQAGLILLARECMRLALSDMPGKHSHFDESSNLTSTNASLIIQRSI